MANKDTFKCTVNDGKEPAIVGGDQSAPELPAEDKALPPAEPRDKGGKK